ncbi:MAG: hypothetical protein KJO16_08390, partial [Muriicola sp.]|nr:hypothetical protein [Muriicola sp.]MBT8283718.1 hypothetical protein [Muriicola sp.]
LVYRLASVTTKSFALKQDSSFITGIPTMKTCFVIHTLVKYLGPKMQTERKVKYDIRQFK